MSVEAIATRVAEIQALVQRAQVTGAPASGNGGFAAALSAQGAVPVAALAGAPGTPAVAGSTGTLSGPVDDYGGSAPATAPGASAAAPFRASSPGEAQFGPVVDAAARRHGVDPALLRGLVRQESGFDPAARSPAGATGLGQLMPATARGLGVTNPLDPAQSADGAARYLRDQLDRFGGDVTKALAAYNAGPGAVQRFGGVPPFAETRAYVQKVTAYADQYRSGGIR